jgi:enolase
MLGEKGYDKKLGDEGGYAVPDATTDQGCELILEGAEKAGYSRDSIGIVLDVAASHLFTHEQKYHLAHHDGDVEAEYLISKFEKLATRIPLAGVEDALADLDWNSWIELNKRLGDKMMIIGDDIFSTNAVRIRKGNEDKVANATMIKTTQIGTLTGAIDAVREAEKLGITPILSHRSGDTESTYDAHLAVGLGVPYVKFGAPARGECVAEYNELLRIEEMVQTQSTEQRAETKQLQVPSFAQPTS